ncbi:alpha/beta fold hydrolase [Halorussus salinisoli]|uniref:alpha/beta fold hydrolase n=1 Tax=Halorussus salinisoli TaxID=2558242 RepID=UPI002A90A357|nr:alpha/beta hydrolase [Halorussus salinisoli]
MDQATPPDTGTEMELHRAVSDDGTEIVGRVHGQGPPLVLVPGALGDGETVWESLLPLLTDRFTCYAMSTRGRGLSGHSTDLSIERLVQDINSFVESFDEPVGLMGWSSGALLSLATAENTDAVSAVAAYEPPVFEVMSEDVSARMMDTIGRVGEAAEEDRLVDAARAWIEFVANDDELADAAELDFFEALAPNVPIQLQEFEQVLESEGTSPTDPSELTKISVPVLLLQGTQSMPDPWFIDSANHVAEHVADIHVREIADAGHLGPVLKPEAVADELGRFFAATPEPI